MSKNYNNEILNDCSWFAEKHRGKNKLSGAHWSTIIRFTPLFDEATRLQQRVDTLEAYIADYCAPTISDKYKETEHLIKEIKESNDLLRSAFMIAKRDGKETNWEAWRKQLEIALTRQHKMMYGEKAQQALNEVTK
jgi:thioesterase domain-containing protein